MLNSSLFRQPLVLGLGLVATAGVLSGCSKMLRSPLVASSPIATVTPTASPMSQIELAILPTPGGTSLPAGVKRFTSIKLGISFLYKTTYGEPNNTIAAKEVGNRAYVYMTQSPVEQGQYLEEFTKDPSDSLKDAIVKRFFDGKLTNDCVISNRVMTPKNAVQPAGFVFAQIEVPRDANDDMETLGPKWEKCPAPYTTTNGIAYFLMDTKHPDKFLFLSIGQYGLMGDATRAWQDTIVFLP